MIIIGAVGILIIACEIGFWVLILAGFIVRYIFHKEKLGFFLLALTPVIDFILLAAASFDLYRGATADMTHGIAAIYIGVSLIYGKSMIAWGDVRFRYYILRQGSLPAPKYGYEHARSSMKDSLKHVLSYLIGCSLLLLVIWLIDDPSRTEALLSLMKVWSIVTVADLAYSLSYFIWPRQPKENPIRKKDI